MTNHECQGITCGVLESVVICFPVVHPLLNAAVWSRAFQAQLLNGCGNERGSLNFSILNVYLNAPST